MPRRPKDRAVRRVKSAIRHMSWVITHVDKAVLDLNEYGTHYHREMAELLGISATAKDLKADLNTVLDMIRSKTPPRGGINGCQG